MLVQQQVPPIESPTLFTLTESRKRVMLFTFLCFLVML